jgi:antitoxin component YwqK of YwqJK toxin-antitoxin module
MTSPNASHGRIGHRALHPALRLGALALPILMAAACSDPEPLAMAELVRQDGAYLHPVTMQPYSGPAFTAYGDPQAGIERRASLRDGRYDGPFELFFQNRKLSVREMYRQGQKDGPYEWYFESGELYERGTYHNGLREGPYEAYFESGQLHEKGSYHHGDFHGPREWYLTDRLIERVTYVNGQIDGPYLRYTANGSLELSGTLRYGNPCGAWIEGSERVDYPTCGYESD